MDYGYLAARAAAAVRATEARWVAPDDLIALYYQMPVEHRRAGGCVWVMRPEVMGQLMRAKSGEGRYLYGDWAQAPPRAILGCPVREEAGMPPVGPGMRSVLFVDFGTPDGTEPVGPVLGLEHPA